MTAEFRVYGPPGTGKTTWLAKEVGVAAERYGEDQVSVCSLTNSAVREAIGRALPIDAENVTTLHARCKRSLGAPAPAESRASEFVAEYPYLADQIPPEVYRASERSGEESAESVLSGHGLTAYELMNLYRQQLLPQQEWGPKTLEFSAKWMDFCQQIGHMDFTGWLEQALATRCLPRQQIVYVDEAQDHTPLQLAVIRDWQTSLRVLVGDDDQNLYEWSGAIPKAFLSPDLPAEQETVLGQSYRVPRSVHAIATKLIERASYRHPKVYLPRDADGEVFLERYDSKDSERQVLPEGLLEAEGTHMVLTSCGYMLDPIIALLRSLGVPFHNPYRVANKKWNPLDSSRDKLRAFLKKEPWTGKEVRSWAGVLKTTGVFPIGMRDRFLPYCESMGDKVIDPKYLQAAFTESIWTRLMSRDLSIFSEFRRAGMTGSWDYAIRVMQRPEEERTPRIILGTIHSVKGGQADHVYLSPDLSRAGYFEYLRADTQDRIIRLFYVGMTRAYKTLTLLAPFGAQYMSWRP